MSQAYVRRAGLEDVATVATLRRAWSEEQSGQAMQDPTFDETMAEWWRREQSQRITWLVDVDGGTVGMLNMLVFTRMPRPRSAAVAERPTQWGYLANVYVDPAHRGRGLGGLLVDAAISHADANRFARVVLSPSEPSRRLYERAGFGPATNLMQRTQPS